MLKPSIEMTVLTGKALRPVVSIHVPADGCDRRDGAKLIQDLRLADIACVKDMVDATESGHDLQP